MNLSIGELSRRAEVKVPTIRFYEEIGKKGGETIKAERGTPFYEEIGRKGGHKVRELIEKGKAGPEPAPTEPDQLGHHE